MSAEMCEDESSVEHGLRSILEELDRSATSAVDKGRKFERLVKAYLRTDPVFVDQFSNVWLWYEWPGRHRRPDTGIDLVAEDRVTGGLVAVQAKFYAPDTPISRNDIDTFLTASGRERFTRRVIFSTSERWTRNAEDALHGQQVPVQRVGLSELEASSIDWSRFSISAPERLVKRRPKRLRAHQQRAVEACVRGFRASDRGKLIMACGTGKTLTALRLAEQLVGRGGSVLFLVPSISLLSQTLREWTGEAEIPISPFAVCSDPRAAQGTGTDEDISPVDLALPSTTDPDVLRERMLASADDSDSMTVVFATYQSINVVARAQASGDVGDFALVVCDEAHRTTGATLVDAGESAFVRVHDPNYLHAVRRLYMTATPRVYGDTTKARAGDLNVVLASMDDESLYGPEFHRLGFGEAVSQGLLADYKVLVLAVDEETVARTFQDQLADENNELRLDDAARIVGCWNGLAKRGLVEHSFDDDPQPMRRAVAFAGSIKDSKAIERLFSEVVGQYVDVHDLDSDGPVLRPEVRHVDGTFNALERNGKLDWLRAPVPHGTCRVLSNVRCLSEGVDVPALDAVMFLSPRRSVVDVVQGVGRVMRLAEGKQYGYIILPVGIPTGQAPEDALSGNRRYEVVWQVLQALRAHDERFDALVNKIELNRNRDPRVNVIGVSDRTAEGYDGDRQLALSTPVLDDWRNAIYARIVAKVGDRRYWEAWARDIARIAEQHITRISALLSSPDARVRTAFDAFLAGLRGNLNDNITRDNAIEMLAQHLITRPVFDALFEGYSFAAHNPVAQSMERMLAVLDEHSLDDENHSLEKFYDSVRLRAKGIDNAEGRQRIIVELYHKFFAHAFPKTANRLGIVYTPVEVVDFILRSADWALRREFGHGITADAVHVIDGFVGTGTFLVRLLQSGLVHPADLARKYAGELHANEILLLAYYIAAVNIETAYQDLSREHGLGHAYKPFDGLVLADTFQMYEDADVDDLDVFPENNERLNRQRGLDIRVVVGNPPWSVGQDSANDNNPNLDYPHLDAAIQSRYADRSTARLRVSLFDSYIRAIMWASRRIKDRGVVCYVTNGGFLDSNSADGLRKALAEEFTNIYVLNLRGNQRTAGEQSRREGGKIFGAGSRATVAVMMLVKNPDKPRPGMIFYQDIGDYLSREEKLGAVAKAESFAGLELTTIAPNDAGDWVNQRSADFAAFIPVGDKDAPESGIFRLYSGGLKTNRDAWAYNFSSGAIMENMRRCIEFVNSLVPVYQQFAIEHPELDRDELEREFFRLLGHSDPTRISWDAKNRKDLAVGVRSAFHPGSMRTATYRPFTKEFVYFHRAWNNSVYQLNSIFPTPEHDNYGFYLPNPGSMAPPFMVLMTDSLIDNGATGSSGANYFPRWRYERVETEGTFDEADDAPPKYRRVDNITDTALARFQEAYGATFGKDDVFWYVYGLLHSPDYRSRYAADLKRMLPRLPLVADPAPFVTAGRRLCELHLGYESTPCYPLSGLDDLAMSGDDDADAYDFYRVEKMRFARGDRSTIVVNSRVTLSGIPGDAHRYLLGSRSGLEWVLERYQVKVDAASKILNDPNDWARAAGNPKYIVELIARIVTVSVESMKVIDALPPLAIRSGPPRAGGLGLPTND